MNEHTVSATVEPHAAPGMSTAKKVVFVWGVVLTVFLVFNMVYWPVRRHRELRHPANFVRRAETLLHRWQMDQAMQTLREGVEAFRPPYADPYMLLASLSYPADEVAHPVWDRRWYFYGAVVSGDVSNPQRFTDVLEDRGEDAPIFSWTPHMVAAVDAAAASFATVMGLSDHLPDLSNDQKLGMLLLAWGDFSFDGHIGATGTRAPAALLAYSGGGMDERRGAHLFVRGVDHASRRRGMHVALLDPHTGVPRHTGVFDLWESAEEALRLQRLLEDAPDGTIGMFAVRDDGSVFLGPALEAALLEFGLARRTFDNYNRVLFGLRSSFAAIGVKGAPQGTALQTWSHESLHGHRGHPVACGVFVSEDAP